MARDPKSKKVVNAQAATGTVQPDMAAEIIAEAVACQKVKRTKKH